MKSTGLLLVASLAANAVLVVLLLQPRSLHLAGGRRATIITPATAVQTPSAHAGTIASRPPEKIWPRLATQDLPALVAQLRYAGFPPAMLRAIVVALVDAQFRARARELQHAANSVGPARRVSLAEDLAISLKSERERHVLLTRLLGPQWKFDDHAFRLEITGKFGPLPPEKMVRVHEIVTDFLIATHEAFVPAQAKIIDFDIALGDTFEGLTPGEYFPEELVAQLKSMEAEKNARLAALLTPAELDEHARRTHPSVARLHRDLGSFEPTEAEFYALFAIRQDLDARVSPNPAETTIPERRAAEARLQSQFAATLGPERYAEYLQATDPGSARLNRLVARLELPVSVAMRVTALQRDATERANTLRADPALRADQRDAQLAALASEATGEVTALLGTRGLEAYRRYGGYWLDLIPPNALTSTPPR